MNAKAKSLIAAAALAIIGTSATAFETYGEQLPQPSTLTRAEVTAELVRAQRADEVVQTAEAYSQIDASLNASSQNGVSRVQVQRELAQSRTDDNFTNEAYGTVAAGTSLASRGGAAE